MNITVNGTALHTDCTTLFPLKAEQMPTADVVILNGFQTNENLALQEGDIVSFIEKGVMPNQAELESLMCARHTPFVHEKVKAAKVAVAGLGGLGSNIAVMLARLGVGHLLLLDFDVVEPSNLNRQSYYIRHLGMEKTAAMAEQIREINPFIEVTTKTVRITEENAVELLKDWDIICEAFDNPQAKAELINTVLDKLPEKPIVSGNGMAGYDSANTIVSQNPMGKLYVCGDGKTAAKVGQGLMAPRVSICAGHQANLILQLILGKVDLRDETDLMAERLIQQVAAAKNKDEERMILRACTKEYLHTKEGTYRESFTNRLTDLMVELVNEERKDGRWNDRLDRLNLPQHKK